MCSFGVIIVRKETLINIICYACVREQVAYGVYGMYLEANSVPRDRTLVRNDFHALCRLLLLCGVIVYCYMPCSTISAHRQTGLIFADFK